VAVAIVVKKGASRVPPQTGLQETCLFGHLGKSAVTVIAEQRVLPVVAEEQVIPAVVVVIAYRAGLAPARVSETCLQSHIGKCAVAVILEKMTGGLLPLGKALKPPAVYEKNIHPVVLVIVEESRAAAGSFQQIFVAVLAAKDGLHVESGLLGNVDELNSQRRPRDWRRRPFGRRPRRCFVSHARIASCRRRLRNLPTAEPKRRPHKAQHFFQRQHERRPRERPQESTTGQRQGGNLHWVRRRPPRLHPFQRV